MNFNVAILLLYQFLARPLRIISTKTEAQSTELPPNITREVLRANEPYRNFLAVVTANDVTYTGIAVAAQVLISHREVVDANDLEVFKIEDATCRKMKVLYSLMSEEKIGVVIVQGDIGLSVGYIGYYVDVSEMSCMAVGVFHRPLNIAVDVEYGVEARGANDYDAVVCDDDGVAGVLIKERGNLIFRLIDEMKTISETTRKNHDLEEYREHIESLRDRVNEHLNKFTFRKATSGSYSRVAFVNVLLTRMLVVLVKCAAFVWA
ncbi:hypothetical protein Trydic_g19353 [Trypoxylus dichotomus]